MTTAYDFTATDIDGKDVSLSDFKGKVLLVVNTASKCGFTPQYTGLEALWRKHRDQGFAVLGFPCDQFGHQEPGDAEEIKNFCSLSYDVSFPMFGKIEVNGGGAHPFYQWLKKEKSGLLVWVVGKFSGERFEFHARGGEVALAIKKFAEFQPNLRLGLGVRVFEKKRTRLIDRRLLGAGVSVVGEKDP